MSLTERTLIEIADHEGVVLESYLDSVGVPTWGIGVTDASGHKVGRYFGNPQSIERVFEVFEWLLRTRYLPAVLRAFQGHELTENQLAAALSFHYNTGAIERADWVRHFRNGDTATARRAFMNWSTPREIIGRRKCERDLFFDGAWSSDGFVPVYEVQNSRPVKPKLVDISPMVAEAMAKVAA